MDSSVAAMSIKYSVKFKNELDVPLFVSPSSTDSEILLYVGDVKESETLGRS